MVTLDYLLTGQHEEGEEVLGGEGRKGRALRTWFLDYRIYRWV